MQSDIAELNDIYVELVAGRTATPVTIRNFLSWFGAQRRTAGNVSYIDDQLSRCDIQTVPGYTNIWVDTPITFELILKQGKRDRLEEESCCEEEASESDRSDQEMPNNKQNDPSFKIGRLKAATRSPIAVNPTDPIGRALTIMITRNFSQLPVMTNERDVRGVVSWASIGERHATGRSGSDVRHYMNDHHEIRINATMFAAINIISEYSYVLVRDTQQRISGIVTASDIALQFEEISTPFLLLSEIENHLRDMIGEKLSVDEIRQTCDKLHLPQGFAKNF